MSHTPVAPPNAYKPGRRLTVGSHQLVITKYISEGGYAHVYTCEISPPYQGNPVACLKRVAVPDKMTLNILRAEVDAMKRLKGHRYIVSYIDSHASRMSAGVGYEVFVLMEYCSRNSLIGLMNTRLVHRLTEPEVLEIMAHITEGVCNMHALTPPLLHRDIKIENVLIDKDGNYKLCDFGSASGILRPPRNIEEFKILQDDIMKHTTAQYRAPEMIDLYRGHAIDEKSDVWALGVFLYKLCYYTTPFEHNQGAISPEMAIVQLKYTFPSNPVFSSRLKNVIQKVLVSDPHQRPNAYQLLEEICKMRKTPVPVENWYSLRKPVALPSSSSVSPVAVDEQTPLLPRRPISQHKHLPPVSRPYETPQNTAVKPPKVIPFTQSNKSQPSLTSNIGSLKKTSTEIPFTSPDDSFTKPFRSSRPSSRNPSSNSVKRPTSMYVSDNYKTYANSSDQLESLKSKIQGPMETIEFGPDSRQHIDSNVAFLRNLSNQDTGRSIWKSQNTGDSVKSAFGRISRHTTGLRKTSEEQKKKNRNSISGLKSLLTGEKKSSKSRTPSADGHLLKSTDSLSGFHSIYQSHSSSHSDNSVSSQNSAKSLRKSSESISESPESRSPSPQKVHSVQSRVKMLLSRTQEQPTKKTASGYGKYTDDGSGSGDKKGSEDFKVPTEVKRVITPQHQIYKTVSSTSTYSTLTPQSTISKPSTMTSPKFNRSAEYGQLKKKLPPPKPNKPSYLKSPPKKRDFTVDETSSSTTKLRRSSLESEIDVDDLERAFNERFPSAL